MVMAGSWCDVLGQEAGTPRPCTRPADLSVVPGGGWGRGEGRPAFDQYPAEVAALADACARAAAVTGDSTWLTGVEMSVT
jgi:hypothetical protein